MVFSEQVLLVLLKDPEYVLVSIQELYVGEWPNVSMHKIVI